MNCTLNNCNNGIYIFNSQPQIIGNIIYNPQQNGIYGEASGLSPLIQANTITRTTNLFNFQGIYLGNSTHPTIINNTISGFSYGSYLGGGCVTQMGGIYYQCNNTFTGNVEGLTTAWGSTTVAGRSNHTGNSNAVYGNNLYDAHSYQYGNLSSYYDYWGGKFLADGTSSNNIQWRLTTNPCNIANQSTSNNDLTSNSMNKSTADDVLVGLDLENEGKIDDAIDFYKNLINNDNYVYFALTNLVAIKNKYSRPEINDYFVNILNSHNKHYGKVKKLMGDICLQNNQFDDAVKAYTEVITNSSTDYDAINARFELLFGYLHIKNNTTLASKLLSELKGMNLTDAEHLIRLQIAYNFINGKGTGMKKNVIPQNNIMPTTYLLYQNYPNPFNPTTTIKYQIPKPGMVSLKVYDILGREMATLVNGNKVEGTYDISFDASRLTNGIYIYQLKVNDYVSNKKMILLK
jgi:tetratricopeptide (TPR) repeat protein